MLWKGSRREAVAAPASEPASAALPCALLSPFLKRIAKVHGAPHLLMIGELCGANVSFFGERGHRVSVAADLEPEADRHYAGALLWDSLALLTPAEARRRTALLYDGLAAGGAALAFFPAPGPPGVAPRLRWRIVSDSLVRPESVRGRTGRAHPYQNREIIALFERYELDLGNLDLTGFRMSFGARVRIELEDGRNFEAEQEVPYGAAGRPFEERRKAVEDKFRRETRYTLRKDKMERAIDLILHLEQASSAHLREIVRLCCSERS